MSRRAWSGVIHAGLTALLSTSFLAAAKPPVKPPVPGGCSTCQIVYTQANNYTTGPQDLMLVKKDGASKTTLLAGGANVLHKAPVWAPDGSWIAFITNTDPTSRLRMIKNDGAGLTDIVERCSVRFTSPAWNPVPRGGGCWLVYSAARDASGACITAPAPGIGWPSQNLWAVHVSLGTSLLVGTPVCLTCDLNPGNQDIWDFPAWSRNGDHLSTLQRRYEASGVTFSFYIFDVSFATGAPALVPAHPFVIPGLDFPRIAVPRSWAHLSDSLLLATRDDVAGTRGMKRLDFILEGDHAIADEVLLAEGSTHNFSYAVWSPFDDQLVDDPDGICVVTIGPPVAPQQIVPSKPKMVDSPDWHPLLR